MALNVVVAIPLGGEATGIGVIIVSAVYAPVHLAIGGTLQAEVGPADRTDRAPRRP